MKTLQPLGRARRTGKARRPAPDPLVPLKVFIAYADVPAMRRASNTIASAIRESGRRVELHPMLWRFQQLASSHWRDRALSAALEADVIVLASSTPGMLPPIIEDWVNHFLSASRGRRTTIVAIAGNADAWTISIEQPAAGIGANSAASDDGVVQSKAQRLVA